jgi:DNA repair protein RadD
MSITFRWYQDEAIESVFDYYIQGGKGHPLIALPTGTGKSLVIAGLIERAMQRYKNQRFMIATHVKELLKQNSDKLRDVWPCAPYGIYSAGLGRRDTQLPIIFGGVASIKNCIKKFGHRDLFLIDEAHLLSPKSDTMYQDVIGELTNINPAMKVVGFTATDYRLGQGRLTNGGLFTDKIYDLTTMTGFNRLLAEGWLCPVFPRHTKTQVDVSEVSVQNGEFNQGQAEKVMDEVTYAACREAVELGADRSCWLVFAAGIKNAENVAQMLRNFGITAVAVHSKMAGGDEARNRAIRDYKNGVIRCIVNNNVLTTGFDHPAIDFIVMLRPTMSPGLWVQMLGRGTRPSPETGKQNCLCLDFAGNTARLGPINDPLIPSERGPGSGNMPVKICEACGTYNHISARNCIFCGAEFDIRVKIVQTASTDELIRGTIPKIEIYDVTKVLYNEHTSKKGNKTVHVKYICGLSLFEEWYDFEAEHPYVRHKANVWWRRAAGTEEIPSTNADALKWAGSLAVPHKIKVHANKKYPEIVGYEEFARVQ